LAQYNFILVVGEQEAAAGTVNVRTRDNEVHGTVTVEALIAQFRDASDNKTLVIEKAASATAEGSDASAENADAEDA
jgi:threonyl-tRNA synthetase